MFIEHLMQISLNALSKMSPVSACDGHFMCSANLYSIEESPDREPETLLKLVAVQDDGTSDDLSLFGCVTVLGIF